MPLDIKEFNQNAFLGNNPDISKKVLDFFRENKNKAFKLAEVKELTKDSIHKPHRIKYALNYLKSRGLITHKPPYYAYKGEFNGT